MGKRTRRLELLKPKVSTRTEIVAGDMLDPAAREGLEITQSRHGSFTRSAAHLPRC